MSVKWMSYIWEVRTDLKGSELYCAIAIADHADADGKCYPGLDTIAQKMRLEKRQIQDLIKRLEKKNVFDVERGNGRGVLTGFQFKRVQDSASISQPERVQDSAKKGCRILQKRVQDSASPPTPPYKDNHIEPFLEPLEPAESKAVLAVVELFEITPPVHTQTTLSDELITDLEIWREKLLEQRAQMDEGQWANKNFKQQAIGRALKFYNISLGYKQKNNPTTGIETAEDEQSETPRIDFATAVDLHFEGRNFRDEPATRESYAEMKAGWLKTPDGRGFEEEIEIYERRHDIGKRIDTPGQGANPKPDYDRWRQIAAGQKPQMSVPR